LTSDPIISARGVTRRFGGLVALDGIDLDVPRGVVQAIIGPNGSGKTTLLNALSGASHADAGSIRIGGNEIFRLKPHRIARLGLARTFQNIRVFENLSVVENVKVAAACNTPTSLFNIVTSNARQRHSEAEIDRSWRLWALPAGRTIAPRNCPTRSSDYWRSRGRWRRSRMFCCSTSRPRA
jgi:branched-chain amino acid transport system ATP-binding protein